MTPDPGNIWWVLSCIFMIAGVAAAFAKTYLEGVLKDPAKADHRAFLESLEAGGELRATYVALLRTALDWVDRFMGDAGKAAASLPSPFGNRTPAPCWTGWSFDRCALIGVLYPFAGMHLTWCATGRAGRLGTLMGLSDEAPWSARAPVLVGLAMAVFVFVWSFRHSGWRRIAGLVVALAVAVALAAAAATATATATATAVAVSVAVAVACAFTLAGAGAGAGAGAVAGAGAGAVAVAIAVAVTLCGAAGAPVPAAVAGTGAFTVVVCFVWHYSAARNRTGVFWCAFWPLMMGAMLVALRLLPRSNVGPALFLVLIGLVPLLNTPFDWLSIGVTRALLRRGCEPDGAPVVLAIVDLLIGIVMLALLAMTLVLGLRLADALIISGGGDAVIDVDAQIRQIITNPGDAANDWIYFTLFSTMIPGLLNLLLATVSVATWFAAPLRRWMLRTIPQLDERGEGTRVKLVQAFAAHTFLSVYAACFLLWGICDLAITNRGLVGSSYLALAALVDSHAPW